MDGNALSVAFVLCLAFTFETAPCVQEVLVSYALMSRRVRHANHVNRYLTISSWFKFQQYLHHK